MDWVIPLLAAGCGSLAFSFVFHVDEKKLHWMVIGGMFSWAVYLTGRHFGWNEYVCGFLAAALTTVYSEVMARVCKAPATVFVVICTIPLIPGAALYRFMDCLMAGDLAQSHYWGLYTLIFAVSMAAGIVTTTMAVRGLMRLKGARNDKV